MTSPWRCVGSFSAPPKCNSSFAAVASKSAAKAREEEESGTYKNNKAFEALRDVRKLQRHEQQQRDVVVGTDGDGKNDGTTGGDDVDVVVAARDEERKTTTKMKKTPKNPFEEARRKPSALLVVVDRLKLLFKDVFFREEHDRRLQITESPDADVTLRRFDDEARKHFQNSSSSSSSSSASCAERSLGNAVRALSYNAETIMFGICAQTGEGIDALKVWTEELNLPKRKITWFRHGRRSESDSVGAVCYNSLSGDAFCSEYHGEFKRGRSLPQF